jgi:NADH:ubiquinone oxidoreductase subunit 5 (subunit L)/multisubunit Na+/H+ antiporter MnhA subunit
MPWTLTFAIVGALSISAFPLTGGFVTKSMIISASGHEHLTAIWLILQLASAGVFLHAGIKFPWFVFFAKDSGMRPKEAPLHMLLAMGFLSFLCILIGVYPHIIYQILPYPVDYVPYTAAHVLSQIQILLFSALAFFVLLKFLQRTNTLTMDTDWFYRKGAVAFMRFLNGFRFSLNVATLWYRSSRKLESRQFVAKTNLPVNSVSSFSPILRNLRVSIRRNSITCRAGVMSPISSINSVPLEAATSRPIRLLTAPL